MAAATRPNAPSVSSQKPATSISIATRALPFAPGAELGHRHPRGQPPCGLHLNPGGDQPEHVRLRDPRHRAHVVHRRPEGIADRQVLLEGRQQQPGAERAQPAHPLQHRRGGAGPLGHVKPQHVHRPARPEHHRGGLRVGPHVVLGGRRRVAASRRPAHDHEIPDPAGEPRLPPHRQRDVGQRPGGHQGDLARIGADGVDDEVDGVPGRRAGRRRRQHGPAQA